MTAKTKAELMRETRRQRKAAGLVEFRAWVTPSQRDRLLAIIDGNRIVLMRRHRNGSYPIISDEIIPDEFLSIVMADLKPVRRAQ